MDLKPFKLDIDELIHDFAEVESTTLAEMKRIWLSKRFSFLFEAKPSTNQAFFMQTLYAHSIGELERLTNLVQDAKAKNIKVASALVKSMLERNMFFSGFVDMNEGSVTERINELTDIQNARIQIACKKLFADTKIDNFIHMNLSTDLEVDLLKKVSSDYATAKELAIKEAGEVLDTQYIKHIAEDKELIGNLVEKMAKDWDVEKDFFYQQTGFCQVPPDQEGNRPSKRQKSNDTSMRKEEGNGIGQENHKDHEENEDFGKKLEEALLSMPYECVHKKMMKILKIRKLCEGRFVLRENSANFEGVKDVAV